MRSARYSATWSAQAFRAPLAGRTRLGPGTLTVPGRRRRARRDAAHADFPRRAAPPKRCARASTERGDVSASGDFKILTARVGGAQALVFWRLPSCPAGYRTVYGHLIPESCQETVRKVSNYFGFIVWRPGEGESAHS